MIKGKSYQEHAGLRAWRFFVFSIGLVLGTLMLEPSVAARDASAASAPAQNTVIVPGAPPLTVGVLNNALAFTEWVLDTRFTFPQRIKFGQMIVQHWTTNNRNQIEGTLIASQVYLLLPLLPDEDRSQLQAAIKIRFSPTSMLIKATPTMYGSFTRIRRVTHPMIFLDFEDQRRRKARSIMSPTPPKIILTP